MEGAADDLDSLSSVPLFPLPNLVLFPRAVIPLHIFEERYRIMTADLLNGSRVLAMALLKEGWELDYHGQPAIEPVVCVGKILTHEQLPDGTYNFLMQGRMRARIIREHDHRPYRSADIEPLAETSGQQSQLLAYRERMITVFDGGSLLATVIGRQFRQLLSTPLSTPEIADLIAYNFLDDIPFKQSLLAETDVLRRVSRIVAAFEVVRAPLQLVNTSLDKPSLN